MALGRLVLRGTVGGLMAAHGLQKLNGSFDGPGREGTAAMMGAIGLHPAKHQALAAGLSETIGGGLTAAGLLSPLGPAMITGTMAVAIAKVHGKNGLWITKGGYEYNLTLIAAAVALAAEGPGALSLDALRRKQRSGFGWGVVALALGLGGAAATISVAGKMAPEDDPASMDGTGPASSGGPTTLAPDEVPAGPPLEADL